MPLSKSMKKTIQRYSQPGKWEVVIPFEKSGEEKEWVGVIRATEPGLYELKVTAEHAVPGTTGRITVKAVAAARAVVNVVGMIKIAKEAQQTDDFLELRVLTLDPTAKATAEPKLEILADEVKASHAASVGPVDPEQVVYFMSRGVDETRAKEEIVEGFLRIGDGAV